VRLIGAQGSAGPATRGAFEITFPPELSANPVDARVLAYFHRRQPGAAPTDSREEAESQQIFGVDVSALAPGQGAAIGDDTLGYPARSLRDIQQAITTCRDFLNRYTTFERADGHRVKLPMDEGEGQHWNSKPGNFYSKPQHIHIDPASSDTIRIQLTETIPPSSPCATRNG